MSLENECNVYKNIISEGLEHKEDCVEYNSPAEYILLSKSNQEEDHLVVGEEIIVDSNTNENHKISKELKMDKIVPMYFEEDQQTYTEVAVNCDKTVISQTLCGQSINESVWFQENETINDDIQSTLEYNENTVNEEADEETIATFVTAAGQQLALYAVEDSEDIFAVAVYDESGDPPTNFQFLMKADVEKLIGEGAVRTVRKPSQIRKQTLTTQPPIFFSKEESLYPLSADNTNKMIYENKNKRKQKRSIWSDNLKSVEDYKSVLHIKSESNSICPAADKESDITYLMMNDTLEIESPEVLQEEDESEHEIMEQSTVQYIFLEADESDSELTFDEIEATLQNLKSSEMKIKSKKSKKSKVEEYNTENTNQDILSAALHTESENLEYTLESISNFDESYDFSDNQSDCKLNFMNNRNNSTHMSSDSYTSNLISSKQSCSNDLSRCTSVQSTPNDSKVKRSRKQQIIFVDREDSEIIIQPIDFHADENTESNRKRGRRKRRITQYKDFYKKHESKRIKRVKYNEVEVIDLDIEDEENEGNRRQEVVEITLDDGKEKNSSDKENEVIMVRDSDDESQDASIKASSPIMQCEHCSRNFRQQRALDTHLRVCSKSPVNAGKLNAQKQRTESNIEDKIVKKQFSCKICQEKFDAAVALARHVRCQHTLKKKRRISKQSTDHESDEFFVSKKVRNEIAVLERPKRERIFRRRASWKIKKLSCTECGRWFPSAALLQAHCLQHATRKSERSVHKCHVCEKRIKSRLLFIRHLTEHNKSKQDDKPIKNVLEKRLRNIKQATHKITSQRRRGRPRKL